MIENRGKSDAFSTRGNAENKTTAQKSDLDRRDFLKTTVGAREEKHCIFLTRRVYSSAPQAPFLCFGYRFGRPGPAGRYLRDKFSADLVFLCAAPRSSQAAYTDRAETAMRGN